jgi:LTXXQ motif family protein
MEEQMQTRTHIIAILALAFGALVAQGSALADNDTQRDQGGRSWQNHGGKHKHHRHGHNKYHNKHHARHGGHGQQHAFHRGNRVDPVASMMRMHRRLELTAAQQATWDKAREQSRENFRNMHATAKDIREKTLAQLKQPGADLKQVAKNQDQFGESMRDARKKMRDTWLGVYDSLDAKQKERVQQHMLAQLERSGGERFGGHRGRG